MDNILTTKDKWEDVWGNVRLPYVTTPNYDIKKQLESRLPKTNQHSFIEIGCAPGGYMAWFNRTFGYKVSGIEYAEKAAAMTIKNMEVQGIDADVLVGDFFAHDFSQKYDVVFSAGFIEHFRNMNPVVERICNLSKRFVVTIVPNIYGINGAISKTIRPGVYAEHNPIDVPTLELIHRNCGMKTLFCNYVGGLQCVLPGAQTAFFNKHKYCARAVNTPVHVLNRLSLEIGKLLCCTPRLRLLSTSLMYLGRKDTSYSNSIVPGKKTDFE